MRSNFAAIILGIIIVIVLALIMSSYYRSYYEQLQQQLEGQTRAEQGKPTKDNTKILLLIFNIKNNTNLPEWCENLSSIIGKYDLRGSIFITGQVAERYPMCVDVFSFNNRNTDIGSQTYHYVNLTSMRNHTEQINEIINGKKTIDNIGRLSSALFKAPYEPINDDIYPLLIASGIVADFSYNHTYSKYKEGEFHGNDLMTYNGSSYSSRKIFVDSLSSKNLTSPIIIEFDNSVPIGEINRFLTKLTTEHKDIQFVSPSELTQMDLTIRID
jgi:Polysaccharide deacetylase